MTVKVIIIDFSRLTTSYTVSHYLNRSHISIGLTYDHIPQVFALLSDSNVCFL